MDSVIVENLISFGLTRQEATIYLELLRHGELTGYELSKETGISRSNVYASLSGLTEKGAAFLIEGESTKYTPVCMNDFVGNMLNELQKKGDFLKSHVPSKIETSTGYITIEGAKNIRNKIGQMIRETKLRLYFMASTEIISAYATELARLVGEGKKIVLLTDDYKLDGAIIYKTEIEPSQIRLITDSAFVLTGELTDDEHDTCLYSGQKNLVAVMKEALKNKITLLGNYIKTN